MEEIMKELMGESFKEGLTKEEISNFFENSVISSGKVVPLEKFTNIEKQYKDSKSEIGKLNQKIEEFNNSKLTDEELKTKLEGEMKAKMETLQKDLIKSKVEKVFETNGIKEDEYSSFIDTLITLDEEKSIASANTFVTALKNKVEQEVKAQLSAELKKAGTLPNGSGNADTKTNAAQDYVNSLLSNSNDDRSVKAKEFYKSQD